jgi:hypothetical protein
MPHDEGIGSGIRTRNMLFINFIRPNRLPLVLVAACVGITLPAGWIFGFPVDLVLYSIALSILGPSTVILILCTACLVALIRNRPDKPTAFLRTKLMQDWKFSERLTRGLPIYLSMPLMFSAFTSIKYAIDNIVPYYADPYVAALDRMIHGTDPWRLLQPIIGFPIVTEGINFFYNLWFFVMYIILSLVVFLLEDEWLRTRYLVAFILSWILIGGLFATLLSSVGPCFYSAFYPSDPYAELIAYLDQVNEIYPLWARGMQDLLLESYRQDKIGFGVGISAMPSMHIAVTVLNAIFLSKIHRLAGIAAWVFAAIIFVGSVHLAWHYAVDGYVAGLLVIIIWIGAGKLTDLFEPRDQSAKRRPAPNSAISYERSET